mmetsp:Transcript_24356/g.56590  ORF Transcript_24356/g.56590 Transcript_24356/m.56590 type:complete len:266 (-) Transcript_24356:817-1614(-)
MVEHDCQQVVMAKSCAHLQASACFFKACPCCACFSRLCLLFLISRCWWSDNRASARQVRISFDVKQLLHHQICTHKARLVQWRTALFVQYVHPAFALDDLDEALNFPTKDRVEERTSSCAIHNVHRRAPLEDHGGDLSVPHAQSLHQGSAASLVRQIRVCLVLQQESHAFNMPSLRCQHQRRCVVLRLEVNIRLVVQQPSLQEHVSSKCRKVKGTDSAVVLYANVRPSLGKPIQYLHIATHKDSTQERRQAVGIPSVRIRLSLQQ